jgi:hypothetical protein
VSGTVAVLGPLPVELPVAVRGAFDRTAAVDDASPSPHD